MLTTARLRLRPWRDEDLEPFAALNADPRVREFFPSLQTHQESAESMRYIDDHFRRHRSRAYKEWLDTIPGARLIVTDYSGHNVPIEQPDLVVETIRRVVEETRSRERRSVR